MAVVENFFNIIYSVHVESSADTQVLKKQFISLVFVIIYYQMLWKKGYFQTIKQKIAID